MRLAISRTHKSCVELFRLVDWAQVCGINQGHSAGRLGLPGDEGLVTSIFLAVALPVAATGVVLRRGIYMASRTAEMTGGPRATKKKAMTSHRTPKFGAFTLMGQVAGKKILGKKIGDGLSSVFLPGIFLPSCAV